MILRKKEILLNKYKWVKWRFYVWKVVSHKLRSLNPLRIGYYIDLNYLNAFPKNVAYFWMIFAVRQPKRYIAIPPHHTTATICQRLCRIIYYRTKSCTQFSIQNNNNATSILYFQVYIGIWCVCINVIMTCWSIAVLSKRFINATAFLYWYLMLPL